MASPLLTSIRHVSQRILTSLCLSAALVASASAGTGPRFVDVAHNSGGTVHLRVQGTVGERHTLQVSADLADWIPLYGREIVDGFADFTDARSSQFRALFYRTVPARSEELAEPLNVQLELDPTVSSSATISMIGGSLSLTNAGGMRVELILTEGAIESDTLVRLTLVKQVVGLPFSGGLLGAVRLEPEGLQLRQPATLKFRFGSPPLVNELAGFAFQGMGEGIHLVSDEISGNEASLRVAHFSGAGFALGTDADLNRLNSRRPVDGLDRFEAATAWTRLRIRRQGGSATATQLDEMEALHRGYFTSVLEPVLRISSRHSEFAPEALTGFGLWAARVADNRLTNRLDTLRQDGDRLILQTQPVSMESISGWRRLDVTMDGKVDREDGKKIFGQGIWKPTFDVNQDGKKDTEDYWAWVVFLSQWDRNGDRAVSPEDFERVTPVVLPEADAKALDAMVTSVLSLHSLRVPAGFEATLLGRATNANTLDAGVRSQVLEHGGIAALVRRNLELARWCFARAFQLDSSNSSALVNLAFTFTEEGRFQEGLRLMAEALALHPTSAAAWNNLGAIYSRHGQLAEALRCHDLAVQHAPRIGQYHLNRAVALLQAGSHAAAVTAAASAARFSPQDSEAQLFNLAIHPPSPGDLAAVQADYESYRQDLLRDQGAPPSVWGQLTNQERMREVQNLPFYHADNALELALNTLRDETLADMRKEFDPIRPKGKSARDDLQAFMSNFPTVAEKLMGLAERANLRAVQYAQASERTAGGGLAALGPILLPMAIAEAQIETALSNPVNAATEFDEALDRHHGEPMRQAVRHLIHPSASASLDFGEEYKDMLQWSSGLGFIAIFIGGAADPEGYGKGMGGDIPNPSPFDPNNVSLEGSLGFSLAGGLVQVEYNVTSGEQKIQFGEGLIVAGTWSPKTGYGFQAGAGIDLKQGPFSAGSTIYMKFGSNGSISVVTEGSAGVLGGKGQVGYETQIVAGTHPAVFSFGDLLGP